MSNRNLFRRYLDQGFTDNGVVELRHQAGTRWSTGWFDQADALLAHARQLYDIGNLFISLNRPAPRVVSNVMVGDPITNADVQFFTRLFFDFDPIRSKDCPSTDEELQHAVRTAREARKIFKAMAWPDPVIAISGNGAHLVYRTHLANVEETRDMLGTIYTGLRQDYSSDHIEFDRAVRNPGRIAPLYGSIKRKGSSTADRPHRQSEILEYPREWKQVSRRSIEGVANFYSIRHQAVPVPTTRSQDRRPVSGAGDYATLDAVAWFTAHGLYRRPLGSYNGASRHAVRCPWEGEHSSTAHDQDTSTVIFEAAGGWPGFLCSHSHCEGRSLNDVMSVLADADRYCARQWEGNRS